MNTKPKKIPIFEREYKFQLEIMNIIHGIYPYVKDVKTIREDRKNHNNTQLYFNFHEK